MVAPATTDDLLELVHKSRLLEMAEIDACRQHPRWISGALKTPKDLARFLVHDKRLTRFQAEHLLNGKWQGFFLGPYKVLEAIAAGSTGVVYLCDHSATRRRLAVKVLQPARGRDAESLERFSREARAVVALDHPNIVRGFDVGRADRCHYLVMEFVEGYSLKQLVTDDGPFSCQQAADYLCQAAAGLQHAHAMGLVHRDIKPSNIMVDRQGTVKILDMGLARFFEDDAAVLTQRGVLGSLDYIAPEQAADGHSADTRADLFSLGATFWFCLTGSPLRQAGFAFLRRPEQVRQSERERRHIPEQFWQILRKMMARNPAERYQTALEIVKVVSQFAPPRQMRSASERGSANPAEQSASELSMSAKPPEASTADTGPPPPSMALVLSRAGKLHHVVARARLLPWVRARRNVWLTAGLAIAIVLASCFIS